MKKIRCVASLFLSALVLCVIIPSTQSFYGADQLSGLTSRIKTPASVVSLEGQSAVFSAQLGGLDVQKTEVERQILALERQYAGLNAQGYSIASQQTLLPKQISQEKQVAAYKTQVSYYRIAILYENLRLLDEQLRLLDKQIEVEETRLMLGESTQNTVDFMYASRIAAFQNHNSYLAQIAYEKELLALQIDYNIYMIVFEIPDTISKHNTRSASELQDNLVRNNISMLEQEDSAENQRLYAESLRNIGGVDDPYYREAISQYHLLVVQKNAYKEQLQLLASNKFSECIMIEAQYQAAISSRSALLEQRTILDVMYHQGEISELDYLTSRYEVDRSLLEIKTAIVGKANNLLELDMLIEGIVLA
jgi:hypothetical protein